MSTTALITGASSGLGAVYANRFAARGHSLILVARRGERLETLAAELRESFNIEVGNIVADLTSEAGIASVEAVLRNETVDILVNNAGMGPIGKTANLSDADAAATAIDAIVGDEVPAAVPAPTLETPATDASAAPTETAPAAQ